MARKRPAIHLAPGERPDPFPVSTRRREQLRRVSAGSAASSAFSPSRDGRTACGSVFHRSIGGCGRAA
ncbi:hypothetical protein [Streptomyces sp. NPDC059092]|uniref:hypothetical protein n=1 Tax=Streptomyces sp. NPDC059092 TaxID=3346725 RepID=UPI00369FC872